MKNTLTNFKYEFVPSTLEGHHEVCVSFKYKEKAVKCFIFIADKENASNSYYLEEAKRRVKRDSENGKLVSYAKGYGKKNNKSGVLVFLIVLFAIAALTFACLFTYTYLKSNGII